MLLCYKMSSKSLFWLSKIILCLMNNIVCVFERIKIINKTKKQEINFLACKEFIWSKIRSKIYQFRARFCVTFISEHPVFSMHWFANFRLWLIFIIAFSLPSSPSTPNLFPPARHHQHQSWIVNTIFPLVQTRLV